MSLESLRKSIIAQIQEIEDEALLLKLLNILERKEHSVEEAEIKYGKTSISEDDIVAFSVDGKPITKRSYIQQLKDAELEILDGETMSQEALEEEAKSW